uniref:Putative ovule protein n=1 Tax=Solanum chacoense TaxID=4108 RepID=A0A0V0IE09_SOLCH
MDIVDDTVDAQQGEKLEDAMRHAWNLYEKYARSHDELQAGLLLLISSLCKNITFVPLYLVN